MKIKTAGDLLTARARGLGVEKLENRDGPFFFYFAVYLRFRRVRPRAQSGRKKLQPGCKST